MSTNIGARLRRKFRKWQCAEGCDQEKWLRETQGPCPHLSRLLGPKIGANGRRIVFRRNIENVLVPAEKLHEPVLTPEEVLIRAEDKGVAEDEVCDEESILRLKLLAYGLSVKKINVLLGRLLYGLTFAKLAKAEGYSEGSAAHFAYRTALEKLRKLRYR